MVRKLLLGGLLVFAVTFGVYEAWWLSKSTRVDAVHHNGNYSDVLVSHFPLTDRGKITWWLRNKSWLKSEYGIPEPEANGNFVILFWAWDGIYRVDHGTDEDSDLRCFTDKKDEANCIVKSEIPLQVARLRDGTYRFYIGKRRYSQANEGDEPRRRRDWEEAEKAAWERSKEESRKLNESNHTQAQ